MSQTLEIPDDLYQRLETAATSTGATPVEWLEEHVPKANGDASGAATLYERMKGYIGKYTIDWDHLKEDPNDPLFSDVLRQQREGRP